MNAQIKESTSLLESKGEAVAWRRDTPYGIGYSFASEDVMRDMADWLAPTTPPSLPAGWVLVPERMHVPADAWESAAFSFGGPAAGDGEAYMDCTLWVGYIENDEGSMTYGLHVSCDECPEEGMTTLAEFAAAPPREAAPQAAAVPDVATMVDNFLGWKLPIDFYPDAGISFSPFFPREEGRANPSWPVGTNLLTAAQAKAMFECCFALKPVPETYGEAEGDAFTYGYFEGRDDARNELTAAPPREASHPDDEAVDRFAAAMKAKLAEARAKGRGGWHEPGLQQRLSDMLRDHVDKGDPRDVANFACFLFNRGEGIAPREAGQGVDDPIVGHKTHADEAGRFYHAPLHQSEADALIAHIEAERLTRERLMPDEQTAINLMWAAWYRLKDFGWKEPSYCPKDGTPFEVIENGSTGIHQTMWHGPWPGGWCVEVSSPALWRPIATHTQEGRG